MEAHSLGLVDSFDEAFEEEASVTLISLGRTVGLAERRYA
jgi:hypothetical protein